MDWSQIQAIFANWGVVQWGIAAAAVALFLGLDKKLIPLAKAAWAKVHAIKKGDTPPATDLNATAALIKELRERQVQLQKELDLINDALADGTEVDSGE